ncbi:MAG: [Fe-Fe] hydrogenase large subunit C-terminal domain-containing protein [Phycisphaerae bacterium]
MPLITTIRERCRMCFTCVRECPAKAIRIEAGQAMVVKERCVGCGNCLRVCSQNAKQMVESIDELETLLAAGQPVVACLAPSFPAGFPGLDPGQVVAGVRKLGFQSVCEVAFGADLVAEQYRKLLKETNEHRFIATSCPALVEFVEKYYPELVSSLAPIVSPMVAMARVIKALHGKDYRVVFIGPCIAKRLEATSDEVNGEVELILTFMELQKLWQKKNINPAEFAPDQPDGPLGGLGTLFPIAKGLLQAAGVEDNLLANDVIATDGRINFVEAIKEFSTGALDVKLLEILCCNGCIMGPGISANTPSFTRRVAVSNYARKRVRQTDLDQWNTQMAKFADLDLTRTYAPNDQRMKSPSLQELRAILRRLGKETEADELNCGACGYDTCREHAIAIFTGLAESEMCLPYSIDQLKKTLFELNMSNELLADTREALVQAEKLASMGQLAAGIAHEVNNPLGVVLMYAHFILEDLGHDIKHSEDLKMIVEQANRCKKIVEGLLNFARQNKVILLPVDFGALIVKTLGMLRPPEKVKVIYQIDPETKIAEIDRDQIAQVLTNLVTNAFAAMPDGGTLTVGTHGDNNHVYLKVADTGLGISGDNLSKIFEPFFTTKQIGKGTGLGLAVTYGIVKMHRGDIKVISNADPTKGSTGTTFTLVLPRKAPQDYDAGGAIELNQEEETKSGENTNA